MGAAETADKAPLVVVDTEGAPALDALNIRQRAFVMAYLQTGNATRAYVLAKYESKSPWVDASALLRNPKVALAVKEQIHRIGVTPERIESAHVGIAWGADPADFESLAEGKKPSDLRKEGVDTRNIKRLTVKRRVLPGEDGDIVEEVTYELYDRQKSLDALSRLTGAGSAGPAAGLTINVIGDAVLGDLTHRIGALSGGALPALPVVEGEVIADE